MDFHFVRERGEVRVCSVSSMYQLADVFTKALSSAKFAPLRNLFKSKRKTHFMNSIFKGKQKIRVDWVLSSQNKLIGSIAGVCLSC